MRIIIEGTRRDDGDDGEGAVEFFYHCDQPLTGDEMADALRQAAMAFQHALNMERLEGWERDGEDYERDGQGGDQ